jgi:membrane peptidoglycan carboxypeptidase
VWESGNLEGATTLANSQGHTGSAIGIGEYEVRTIDQAHGFATFANGGIERDPFFVQRVTDNSGAVLLDHSGDPGTQVLDPEVANDVTYALTDVADWSDRPLDDGRDVASKTGTQGLNAEDNSDAWMVGYTPSLSTAVWMGSDVLEPIVDARGRIIYGSGLPGAIWQRFMSAVLEGTPEEDLPDSAMIDGDTGEGVPAPTTEPPPTTESVPTTTPPTTTPPTTEPPVPDEENPEDPADPGNGDPDNPAPGIPVPPGPGGGPDE